MRVTDESIRLDVELRCTTVDPFAQFIVADESDLRVVIYVHTHIYRETKIFTFLLLYPSQHKPYVFSSPMVIPR